LLDQVKFDMMNAKRVPASIRHTMTLISQIWSFAERDGVVTGKCPTKQVKLSQQDNRRGALPEC